MDNHEDDMKAGLGDWVEFKADGYYGTGEAEVTHVYKNGSIRVITEEGQKYKPHWYMVLSRAA